MVVQAAGFEPAKHYAEDLEPSPFDHSGTPAVARVALPLLIPALHEEPKQLFDGMVDLASPRSHY